MDKARFAAVAPQALLLSGRHAGLYTIYTQRWASSLCYCRCDLTEVGSPMISRVNNDVTLGLTNDQWSTPL